LDNGEEEIMKRMHCLVTVLCSAVVVGCSPTVATWQPPKGGQTKSVVAVKVPAKATAPETLIVNFESKRERAAYLRELAKDPHFDPKQHAEMLEKYSNDADPEISGAAKELYAKAQ
jgi:hypothetical protein